MIEKTSRIAVSSGTRVQTLVAVETPDGVTIRATIGQIATEIHFPAAARAWLVNAARIERPALAGDAVDG